MVERFSIKTRLNFYLTKAYKCYFMLQLVSLRQDLNNHSLPASVITYLLPKLPTKLKYEMKQLSSESPFLFQGLCTILIFRPPPCPLLVFQSSLPPTYLSLWAPKTHVFHFLLYFHKTNPICWFHLSLCADKSMSLFSLRF